MEDEARCRMMGGEWEEGEGGESAGDVDSRSSLAARGGESGTWTWIGGAGAVRSRARPRDRRAGAVGKMRELMQS